MTIFLTGRKIGRLTVLHSTSQRQGNSIVWKCSCECGNKEAFISARDLLHSGAGRRGCGSCADSKDPLYGIWKGIIQRTSDLQNPNYGGRGISLFPAWRINFLAFRDYMNSLGPRLPGYSVDRINNDGNYEPGNVRWADAFTQANNQRKEERGLSREAILEIYFSKNSVESCAAKFGVSIKTARNIRARSYSKKATEICLSPTKEELQKFSSKISAETRARLQAMLGIPSSPPPGNPSE